MMVLEEVEEDISMTSGYLEWASITIRYMGLRKGPAKSTWILFHD